MIAQTTDLFIGKKWDFAAALNLYSSASSLGRFPEWCTEFRAAVDTETQRLQALGRDLKKLKLTRPKIPTAPFHLSRAQIKEMQEEMAGVLLPPNVGQTIRGCLKTKDRLVCGPCGHTVGCVAV